jgi:8-oxo-dGTP diphosphatase
MPDRTSSARGAPRGARSLSVGVDVVLFTPRGAELAVVLLPSQRPRSRERWTLPQDGPRADETLEQTGARLTREVVGTLASYLGQAGATGGGPKASDGAQVTVVYFALVPTDDIAADDATWSTLSDLPQLPGRQRQSVDAALAAMRAQVDQQPIAFRLLPLSFTLSELQAVYELLLGRRLHKASFRRSLHASALVEATDEWRSEGRGRPAQLFRYAPPRRKKQRRGVRFDLIS